VLAGFRFLLKSNILANLHAAIEVVVASVASLLARCGRPVLVGGKLLFVVALLQLIRVELLIDAIPGLETEVSCDVLLP
jgi:hypothetical protein